MSTSAATEPGSMSADHETSFAAGSTSSILTTSASRSWSSAASASDTWTSSLGVEGTDGMSTSAATEPGSMSADHESSALTSVLSSMHMVSNEFVSTLSETSSGSTFSTSSSASYDIPTSFCLSKYADVSIYSVSMSSYFRSSTVIQLLLGRDLETLWILSRQQAYTLWNINLVSEKLDIENSRNRFLDIGSGISWKGLALDRKERNLFLVDEGLNHVMAINLSCAIKIFMNEDASWSNRGILNPLE